MRERRELEGLRFRESRREQRAEGPVEGAMCNVTVEGGTPQLFCSNVVFFINVWHLIVWRDPYELKNVFQHRGSLATKCLGIHKKDAIYREMLEKGIKLAGVHGGLHVVRLGCDSFGKRAPLTAVGVVMRIMGHDPFDRVADYVDEPDLRECPNYPLRHSLPKMTLRVVRTSLPKGSIFVEL